MPNQTLMSCIVAFIAGSLTTVAAQDDPMDVFTPMLGSWTTESEVRASRGNAEKSTGTGEVNVATILGDRFIQAEGFATSPRIGRQDYRVLMTFDKRQGSYRRWMFRSDGVVAESKGVWNAENSTMTWSTIGLPKNVTFTITTSIHEDRFEETLLGKGADGSVSMDLTYIAKKK